MSAYCPDLGQLFGADREHVVCAETFPGGSGNGRAPDLDDRVLTEAARLEYVEVVSDRRIVIAMQPTMSLGVSRASIAIRPPTH